MFSAYNVTPATLEMVRLRLEGKLAYYMEERIARLGGQIVSGEVLEVRQHAILADRIVVSMSLVIPAPFNNVDINVQVVI